VALHLLTWNLQGSAGVDVDAVAEVITDQAVDTVVLQEVQRAQAGALSRVLGLPRYRWTFKHWPVVSRAEGMAIMTGRAEATFRTYVVRRAPWWSWRRRVGLDVTIPAADGSDPAYSVVCMHLSAHHAAARRSREVELVLARHGQGAAILAGDLNDGPDGPVPAVILGRGWADAWTDRNGAVGGATNWTAGRREGRRPTQRLDYVFAPAGWSVRECRVVDAPLEHLAELSDHLPLVAVLEPSGGNDG